MAKKVENQTRDLEIPKQVKDIIASQKLEKEKPKTKPAVKEIIIWCVSCNQNFTVLKKDNKGVLIKQQVCPHTIFQKVLLKCV